ncbi:hypothetical protein D3C78_1010880 [compost metagenome]
MTKSDSLMRPFDQARQISHNKAASVTNIYDSQIRCNGREMVSANLRLCSRNNGQQSRFAYAWKSDQSDIRHYLQLQHNPALLAFLAIFRYIRRRIALRCKPDITTSAATALGNDNLLSVTRHIGNNFLRIIVNDDCAGRDAHNGILSACPMHALNLAALSAFRLKMLLVAEIHQRT